MISPELIAPDELASSRSVNAPATGRASSRVLVVTDSGRPIKVVLRDGTMTIGRAETANIRLDGQYVSRIHARIICGPSETIIEDAGSRNGFRVNSMPVKRHALGHGDVITIGKRRITFLETTQSG